jgi:peptidoglycan/LPS O-acetylase OafA/YrhL
VQPRFVSAWWILNFVLSTFVLSIPEGGGAGLPFFGSLWSLTPTQYLPEPHYYRFWPAIGAVHLVFAIDNAPFLQAMFETPLAQYLGRISFSLYMVHGALLQVVGTRLVGWCMSWTGNEAWSEGWGYFAGMLLGGGMWFLLLIWLADLVARTVDERSVRVGRWLWEKSRGSV